MSEVSTLEQAITQASQCMAVSVGEELLKNHTLLLPSVYDTFTNEAARLIELHNIATEQDIWNVVTPRWFRNQLSSMLDFHISYQCSIKKYGTVLYRYGGDLMYALNAALGQVRMSQNQLQEKEEVKQVDKSCTEDHETQLVNACTSLNGKIHATIHKLMERDSNNPHDICELDIDKCIGDFDHDLWKATCLLTKPKSGQVSQTESTTVRKTQRFFCLCAMLFCTNSRCSFPLHTLLTDVIESCGGSTCLVRTLNRLGVCASADTHA